MAPPKYETMPWMFWDTVDGSEIRLASWYRKYPIIYRVWDTSKPWLFGISEPPTGRISRSNQPPTNPPVSLQELAAAAQSVLLDSHAPSEAGRQSRYPQVGMGIDTHPQKRIFKKKQLENCSQISKDDKTRCFFSNLFFGQPRIGGLDLSLAVISFRWVVIYPRAQPPSREAHTPGKPFTNITRWTLLRFLTNLVSFFKCLFKSGRWQRDTVKDPCINTPFLGLKKRGLLCSSGMQNPRMLVVTTRIHLKKFTLSQWDFQWPPTIGPFYGKFPILFPYHSHVWIPKDMGMVWVPLTIGGGRPWEVPGKSPLRGKSEFSQLLCSSGVSPVRRLCALVGHGAFHVGGGVKGGNTRTRTTTTTTTKSTNTFGLGWDKWLVEWRSLELSVAS